MIPDRQKTKFDAPLQNDSPVPAADVVCDLCREAFVVHQEKVDFPHIADQEFLEAVGE